MTRDFPTRARGRKEFYIYTLFLLLWHIGHACVGEEFSGIFYIFVGKTIQDCRASKQ